MNKVIYIIAIIFITCSPIAVTADYDFGDEKSSTLTEKAWLALEKKDFDGVLAYTDHCLMMYSEKALDQQSQLSGFAPAGEAASYWALNDVATCLFIKAKALSEMDRKNEAKDA